MKRSFCERYYDRVAHSYDDSYQSPYWEFYNAVTWNNIKKYLPRLPGRKILDIGGGTGQWALRLAKSGFKVTCADVAQKMLDKARQKSAQANLHTRIEFIKADICDLSMFKLESFDLVLAEGDPLSYCADPRRAVKEAYRVLKQKGFFIASVDNRYGAMRLFVTQNQINALEEYIQTGFTNWFTKNEEEQYPIKGFTPDELRKLFSHNGFEVLSIIGKVVLPISSSNQEILQDRAVFERLLKLELQLNSEESLLGSASHIEITGIKHSAESVK